MSDKACGVAPRGQADALVIVSTVFLVIAIVCTLLRAAARVMGRNIGMDDVAVVLGLVCLHALTNNKC